MLRKLQCCSCQLLLFPPGPRWNVHLDSTFLHGCRVGALIYDSEAGWSHKTLCCLSRSWTKATCQDMLQSSTINPCEVYLILNSHHRAQALACDSVPALCSLYNSRVRNPSWEDWCVYGCNAEEQSLSTSCCLDRHIQHWTFDREIPLADLSGSTR